MFSASCRAARVQVDFRQSRLAPIGLRAADSSFQRCVGNGGRADGLRAHVCVGRQCGAAAAIPCPSGRRAKLTPDSQLHIGTCPAASRLSSLSDIHLPRPSTLPHVPVHTLIHVKGDRGEEGAALSFPLGDGAVTAADGLALVPACPCRPSCIPPAGDEGKSPIVPRRQLLQVSRSFPLRPSAARRSLARHCFM